MTEFAKVYEFPSQYAEVRRTLAELLADLRAAGIDGEDAGIIEVVMAEALNNVVEHAYREAPDGVIVLTSAVSRAGLSIALVDHGVAMPGLTLPEGACPTSDTAIEDLPEGGFGWHLIHTLTEELTYRREQNQNKTSFVIPLTSAP